MGRASTLLAAGVLVGFGQAFAAPLASADRQPSDITCATGERATYDEGAHRFRSGALVLGCARVGAAGRLQVDGSAGGDRGDPRMTCLDVTHDAPDQMGSYVCRRLWDGYARAEILLLIRYRSSLPVVVLGTAPKEARWVGVSYAKVAGARGEASARVLGVDGDLAKRVGAPRGFAIFVAGLGPGAEICRGIIPRAFDKGGRRLMARRAVPEGFMGLRQHAGWVSGFTPNWGIGFGGPDVCGPTSEGERSQPALAGRAGEADSRRPTTGRPDSTGGFPWLVGALFAGVLALTAVVALRRLRARG